MKEGDIDLKCFIFHTIPFGVEKCFLHVISKLCVCVCVYMCVTSLIMCVCTLCRSPVFPRLDDVREWGG